MKGISRIDSKKTHGWYVRIYRDGSIYAKFFSDSRFGGKEEALDAAQQHKAAMEDKYPLVSKKPIRDKPQRNSRTGVVGVCRTYSRERNGERVPYYSVSWNPEPGKSRNRKFSVKLYGEEEAFRLAVEFRKEKEVEILEQYDRQQSEPDD